MAQKSYYEERLEKINKSRPPLYAKGIRLDEMAKATRNAEKKDSARRRKLTKGSIA